jgi:hypothetical protein
MIKHKYYARLIICNDKRSTADAAKANTLTELMNYFANRQTGAFEVAIYNNHSRKLTIKKVTLK